MPRLILLALILFSFVKIYAYVSRQPAPRRRQLITRIIIGLAITFVVIFTLMGRLPWVSAFIAFLLPVINYLAKLGIRFLPLLLSWLQKRTSSSHSSTHDHTQDHSQSNSSQQSRSRSRSSRQSHTHMSQQQARQVLGVSDHADKREILKAYRRLMQRVHPDQGGNDYLASQLNQAKDTLLG